MGLEKKRDEEPDSPPSGDGKDLMQSTLIALGWEEGADGDGSHKALSKDEIIKQLKQENQALAKQAEEKVSAIKEGEGKIASLLGELERCKAKAEQLEKAGQQPVPSEASATLQGSDVKDLAEKLAMQEKVNAGLEAKLKELAAAREAAPAVSAGNVAELASKNVELESAIEKLKGATSKIDEQSAMIAAKDSAIAAKDTAIAAKDATIADQVQKINELDEGIKELKKQVVDIIGENTGLGGEVQAKLEQLSQRESKIGQMEAKIRQQEEELSKTKLTIDTLRSENEDVHYRVKEYEEIVDKQKKDLLQSESNTSEDMSKLQQIIDEHKDELTALKKDKLAAASRADSLAKQIEDGEKKRIGVEAVLEKTSKDLTFYQEKYFEQKARIKSLDTQVEELQRSNEQKSALVKDLEMARATFDTAKKAMDAEASKLVADLDKQKAAIAEKLKASEEGGIFKVKLEQAEAKVGQFEAALAAAQKSTQAAEKDAKETKARLEEQLKVSKSKIDQLEKEVESSAGEEGLMEEVMKTADENTKLKEALAGREKELEKYKRRVGDLQEATKDKAKTDEEIKNLKIGNKELRRRLEKYEKP